MSETPSPSGPICQECGEPVDPDSPAVVRAMPAMHLDAPGMAGWIDSMGVYFHEDCFPFGASDWSVAPR
jgi:hypothetical protein